MKNMELLCNGTLIENATWADVEAVLDELKDEVFFRLSIEPRPESGPLFLEIESENGYYKPSILNADGTGKGFSDPEGEDKEMVEIGGYEYDAMCVTRDFDLILQMIKEFYETGRVYSDLWHPRKEKTKKWWHWWG